VVLSLDKHAGPLRYRWHRPALLQPGPPGANKLPGPSCLTTTYFLARTRLWSVIYRNLKSKVTTLKFSVHCPLDNKTMWS